MDKIKRGRPKTNQPTRNKSITIRISEDELQRLQKLCYDERIGYIDVLLKGLSTWSRN